MSMINRTNKFSKSEGSEKVFSGYEAKTRNKKPIDEWLSPCKKLTLTPKTQNNSGNANPQRGFSTNNTNNEKNTNQNPIIENINSKKLHDTTFNKYKKCAKLSNINGFVVNVHDATNFDIDLSLTKSLHDRYQDVISNQYTYQDFLPTFDINYKDSIITPKIGTTYRCRLKGIGVNTSNNSQLEIASKIKYITKLVKQLINLSDGCVICTISDVDVYQRLLVEITLNVDNKIINLKEFILEKSFDEGLEIFFPYKTSTQLNKQNKNISSSFSEHSL